MTVVRLVILLMGLTLVGIAAVSVRVDQRRCMYGIQKLQLRETELRREIWSQEIDLARWRSPPVVRDRAQRLGLEANPANKEKVPPVRR